MAAVQLTGAETGSFTALDNKLDQVLADGLNDNGGGGGQQLVPKVVGYAGFEPDFQLLIRQLSSAILGSMIQATAWVAPSFSGAWSNWSDAAYSNSVYRKTGTGEVELQGLARSNGNGVNTVIFTLPVGFRPIKHITFAAVGNDQFARINVESNGDVKLITGSIADTWFSLNGIRFRPEQ